MNFIKQAKEYLIEEVKGCISNNFKFTIKDLYKKDAHRIHRDPQTIDCQFCGVFLTAQKCLYCGKQNQEGVKQTLVKNWSIQRPCEQEEVSVQCMIIMVDLSGSMNITYPSNYRKLNKDFIIRAIGPKNYEVLKNAIGEQEVIKNFKGIQTLLESGQSVRDIAFSFKQQLAREKKKGLKASQNVKNEELEYMSRKEIIQVGITHYINTIRSKRPNTIMTVVYFNSNIEYPVNNFAQCKIVGNLHDKTLEQILEAGREAAGQISLSSIQQIGDKLVANMTKAQAQGQTAMTPALAFCLGMTSKWKHDLNQIVIVTDGLSNVGIGQTEEPSQLEGSKALYEQLANKYAIKSNCVVNVISFDDCAISYDVIDEVIKRTGGVPYSIGFIEQNKQKVVDEKETINYLCYQMTTGFCQSTKQFCFDNKLVIKISHPDIHVKIPEDLQVYIKIKEKNWVSFDLGVRSVNEKFEFGFVVDQTFNVQQEIVFKITVLHQYRRNKKVSFIVREDIAKIKAGAKQQAIQSQAKILKKAIEQKLRKRVDDDNYEDYESISKKMEKLEVVQTIDKDILERFNKKKAVMQEFDKNVDKINKDKRAIQSRRKETYNRRKYSEEDIFA